jgi:FkbM family methyltransferase
MNLRQLTKYVLSRDTTHNREFSAMHRLLPFDAPKVVVDVGANDGFHGSNSFPLVARGRAGILIEPYTDAFAHLQELFLKKSHVDSLNKACAETRGKGPLFLCADSSQSTLGTDLIIQSLRRAVKTISVLLGTLSDILSARKIPKNFGVLTIDTEGMDYEVLPGLDFSVWRPRVIITGSFEPKELNKAAYPAKNGHRLADTVYANTIWVETSNAQK